VKSGQANQVTYGWPVVLVQAAAGLCTCPTRLLFTCALPLSLQVRLPMVEQRGVECALHALRLGL
jgi:hypothetical protein